MRAWTAPRVRRQNGALWLREIAMSVTRHVPLPETALERARALVPEIAARADDIDRDRELPADLAERIADAGMFRLLVPRSLGGHEMGHPDYLEVVEILARADGGTAWSVNQGAVFATSAAFLPGSVAEAIWADTRAVCGSPIDVQTSSILKSLTCEFYARRRAYDVEHRRRCDGGSPQPGCAAPGSGWQGGLRSGSPGPHAPGARGAP